MEKRGIGAGGLHAVPGLLPGCIPKIKPKGIPFYGGVLFFCRTKPLLLSQPWPEGRGKITSLTSSSHLPYHSFRNRDLGSFPWAEIGVSVSAEPVEKVQMANSDNSVVR
jgi:hypothetical protein